MCEKSQEVVDSYPLGGYFALVANQSNQFRMADRMAGGRLAEVIDEMHVEGRSYEDIARRLYADYGIEISRQTVARWHADAQKVA